MPLHTEFRTHLREAGLRATSERLLVLGALSEEAKPIAIEALYRKLKDKLDKATLYRTLEAFRDKQLVERTDLQHGHAHYELLVGREHHHHAVCRSCGLIEDVEIPHVAEPAKAAESKTKKFQSINSYVLEFFGTCRSCA